MLSLNCVNKLYQTLLSLGLNSKQGTQVTQRETKNMANDITSYIR